MQNKIGQFVGLPKLTQTIVDNNTRFLDNSDLNILLAHQDNKDINFFAMDSNNQNGQFTSSPANYSQQSLSFHDNDRNSLASIHSDYRPNTQQFQRSDNAASRVLVASRSIDEDSNAQQYGRGKGKGKAYFNFDAEVERDKQYGRGKGKGKEFFHWQAEVERDKEEKRHRKAIIAERANNLGHIPQKKPKLPQSQNATQKIGKTSRSIGAPKNQEKIRELVNAQKKSASFEYTLDGIDGLTINYLLNDKNNTVTVTIFTEDKKTGDIYALNTVNYPSKEKDSIIKDIKEGRYHPNVPVEINGKKYTIPFEYHNNDIVDIAKHYKIPTIQQDNQGQEINDANKTYSFYNANGQEQPYQKALMKNIPLCLINIDGHLSLCDFRDSKTPVILDTGFLFEKSIDKKVDEERMQMQNNIKNLIGGSPVYIGIAVENENNTDVVKSQLLDETNCVTGLMAILLDGYNPKKNINKHLCDMADHLQQVHDGKSILDYQLLEKESIMSWYLNCHEKLKKDNKYTSIYELQYDKYLDRMIDSSNGERKAKLILIKESGLQFTGSSLGMVLRSGTAKELKKKIKVIKEAKESGLEFTDASLGMALQHGTAKELEAKIKVIKEAKKSGLQFTGSALGLALQCGTAKELKKKIKVIKEANASGLQLTGSALGMVLRSGTAKELKKKIKVIKSKIGDLPVSWEMMKIPLKNLEQHLEGLDIEQYKEKIQKEKIQKEKIQKEKIQKEKIQRSKRETKQARISKAVPSEIVVKAILALENLKATHEVDKRVKQDGFSRRVRAQMSADTKVMDKGNDNDSRSKFYKDHADTIIRNLEKTSSQRKQTQTEIVKLIAFFNQLEVTQSTNNQQWQDTNEVMSILGKRNDNQRSVNNVNSQGETLQVTTEFFSGLSASNLKKNTKKREIKEYNKNITKQKQLESRKIMEIGRV